MSLPQEWKMVKVNEVGLVQAGRQRSVNITKGTQRPYLRVANVFAGHIDISDVLEMPFTDSEHKIYRLQENDILLNEGQSLELVGRSAIYKNQLPDCCFQNTLVRFRPKQDIDVGYAHGLFEFLRETGIFASIATKTTSIAHLGVERFATLKIPLPPLPEQQAIARVLSSWDAAISDLSALIAKKLHLKRALMQRLLSGEVRFGEFEGMPWRRVAIGEVLQLTSRFVAWDDAATYNLASVRRNSGGLFWRGALQGAGIKVKKLHTVREGDFLISHIQAAYGATGLVPKAFDGAHVSDMYSILTPKPGFETRFMDLLSQTPLMRQLILLSSNGFFAERLRLNFDPLVFLKQKIPVPPTLAEQRKIAAVLDGADAEISALQSELALLKEQKRGLMARLLSGTVRVPLNLENSAPVA